MIAFVFLAACKTKLSAVNETTASEELAATKVIKEHYSQKANFKTLNIRTNAKYEDDKTELSFTADIRIIKDEIIWINIKKFSIPMAKALITPSKVSYYEVINGTYFDGNYDLISNWLGTDLDFQKVQNLFIGKTLDDLTKQTYIATIVDGLYKLTEKNKSATEKEYHFEASNFLLKKEWVSQPAENRNVTINYPSFTNQNNMYLPTEISIDAIQKKPVKIEIQYKNVTFDENFNTPFSIPDGYEEIKIK